VHAHYIAQQEVARPAGQNCGRKVLHVTVNRWQQWVLEIMAVRVHLGARIAIAVGRHQSIIEHCVRVKGVAAFVTSDMGVPGAIALGSASPSCLAQDHSKRENTARRSAEDCHVLRVLHLQRRLPKPPCYHRALREKALRAACDSQWRSP
jgi:hypothetical protein